MSERTTFPTGSHWGIYEVDVVDGSIVDVRPSPLDPEPTPIHRSLPDIVKHPTRVLRPMVRAGYLKHGIKSDRDGRGAEPFVPVSWDDALDLVAGEIERIKSDYGAESIFAGSYGWASSGRLHHPRTLMKRLLALHGGFTDHVLDYSRAAALVIVPRVVGTTEPVGMNLTAWKSIIDNTELIVSFGGLSPKNFQIDSGGMGRHRGSEWMQSLRDNSVEVVYAGPLRDDIADVLGAEWLGLRPNTDTALMLGLAHTLYTESLHDRAFLDRYTVGFDEFARYLAGESDGTAKNADWAAAICKIDADAIRSLARRMGSRRTMITLSYSLQRADHGEQPMWMGITLAAMVGQIGLPGGGFGIGYGSMGTKGGERAEAPLRAMTAQVNPTGRYIPVSRISDMLLNPGAIIDFDGKRITYPDVRMVWWGGGNPFHHHQDINKLIAAWRRPETIVIQEPFWTSAARHADIVLPVATTLERNDISAGWMDRTVYAMRKAIEPVGESRSDYEIATLLSERLGHKDAFTEGRSEMDWIRSLYDALRKQIATGHNTIPDFDNFWDLGQIDLPPAAKPFVMFEEFRSDPLANPLRTPSGKIEIFSKTIAGFGYDDCPGHPAWIPPAEWLGAALSKRFPLHMISNQPGPRLHSQTDPAPHSLANKVKGREPILLNSSDAVARGIADGDIVRVFNDRGACLAGARITDLILPGVVQLATGAWYDPLEAGKIGSLDVHGNPNVLTLDKGSSKLAQAPIAHSALVEVERFEGEIPPIRVHSAPPVVDSLSDWIEN